MKHTPLPWQHHPEDNIISGDGGKCLMTWQTRSLSVSTAERDANAAFIVRAVNSHAALTGALKLLLERLDIMGIVGPAVRRAEEALAAAEAQP